MKNAIGLAAFIAVAGCVLMSAYTLLMQPVSAATAEVAMHWLIAGTLAGIVMAGMAEE